MSTRQDCRLIGSDGPESIKMKLKLDDKGSVVLNDGKPVYVAEDGKEIAFDYDATLATISRLNGEAKGHREAKEAAESKLKMFDGIDDVEKAKKALETLKNLDDKKLIDAGDVERIKNEVAKAYEEKMAALEKSFEPVKKERDDAVSALHKEIVGNAFSRSKFIAEKLAIPSDIAQKAFGDNFKVKDGKIVAQDGSGNPVFSRARPGEIADFDEALELLVDNYAFKEHILKGSGASGSGAGGSHGANGSKTMTRAQFDNLDATSRMQAMRDGNKIVD